MLEKLIQRGDKSIVLCVKVVNIALTLAILQADLTAALSADTALALIIMRYDLRYKMFSGEIPPESVRCQDPEDMVFSVQEVDWTAFGS